METEDRIQEYNWKIFKMEVTKDRKTVFSDEEGSNSSFSSDSSINTFCSPEALKWKAERKISKLRKFLEQAHSEESLRGAKKDAKYLTRKLDFYMTPNDQVLEELIDEIETLLIKMDVKIEEKKTLNRKQSQLPRGQMMVWTGKLEEYVSFKRCMKEMLVYDISELNLSTLKNQITGENKEEILDYICNVENIDEAFGILDVHFGSIRTIIPRLKKQLNMLKNFPKSKEEENGNIQKILNFWKIMKSHKKEDSVLNYEFIMEMSNKMGENNKMRIITERVEDCGEFIKQIKNIQMNNSAFLMSQPALPLNENPENVAETYQTITESAGSVEQSHDEEECDQGEENYSQSNECDNEYQGYENQGDNYGYGYGYNNGYDYASHGYGYGFRQKRKRCNLGCSEEHATFQCPNIVESPAEEESIKLIIDLCKTKQVCHRCLWNIDINHKCDERTKRHYCQAHQTSKAICKCKPVSATICANKTIFQYRYISAPPQNQLSGNSSYCARQDVGSVRPQSGITHQSTAAGGGQINHVDHEMPEQGSGQPSMKIIEEKTEMSVCQGTPEHKIQISPKLHGHSGLNGARHTPVRQTTDYKQDHDQGITEEEKNKVKTKEPDLDRMNQKSQKECNANGILIGKTERMPLSQLSRNVCNNKEIFNMKRTQGTAGIEVLCKQPKPPDIESPAHKTESQMDGRKRKGVV